MKKQNTRYLKIICTATVLSILVGCGGTANLANMTALELFTMGKKAYDDKKYIQAVEYFQTVVYNHGGESFVDTAQHYLAMSYFGSKDYGVAAVEFNRLALNYPSSVFFENGIFMRAVCFFETAPRHHGLDQTELLKALKQLEDFIIDFPESPLVEQARQYLALGRGRIAKKYYESGLVYKRIGGYTAAQKYFQLVLDDYTDSEQAPKSLFEIAEINLKLKKYPEARAGFDNFVTLFKEHQLAPKAIERAREAAFNSGVIAFDKGELTAAKERFELFIKDFPNDDRVGSAKEYLSKIEDKQSLLTKDGHAES